MDITDYIPNIFGAATPTSYENLQTMGLITPQQLAQQQKTANIQGLLGAGLALAQGMSRTGPRRTAAENIFGALAGGFGAAGGAYQQGIQNIVQQQQLQSAALQQSQAATKLRSIAEAKAKYPDLAQLFDIDASEATKQVINRERAKMYGFGVEPTQAQVPAQMPAQAVPQPELPSSLAVTSKGTQFVGVPNFAAGERYVDDNLNQQVQQTLQPRPAQAQAVPMVDQASVAKANENRRKAAFAYSMGDEKMGKFFTDEAERLDPKEQLFFRDDKLVSSKRGIIGDFSGGKILTNEQATALGLDPNRGKWTIKGGIPSLVAGTGSVRDLTKQEVINRNLDPNKQWQITPEGEVKAIQGSDFTSETSKKELISSLPNQFTNVYPTLKSSVDALIARAPTMTRDQIVQETERILTADADIRKELDPTLQSADIKKRQAGAAKVNVSVAEKKFGEEFGRGVAGAVETTYNKAASAQQTISTINNIRPLIKDGVYSGPLSTSNMYIDRLASSLGITSGSINDKLVRTSQAMQGLASLELSAAEAMKGQGAITENERSLIARAAGGNFAQFTAAEVSGLLNALEKTAKSKISAHTKNLERLRKRKDTADLADFYELQSTDNLQDAARQELERRKGK
jgi:hypothetical protein